MLVQTEPFFSLSNIMRLALFVWLAFPAILAVREDSSFSQTGNVQQGTDVDTGRIQELDVNTHSTEFKTGNLKILSLNVFGHRFAGPGERQKRLHVITTKIQEQNYDVVMLQEFFRLKVLGFSQGSGTLHEFRSNMTNLGLVYHTSSQKSNPFLGLNAGVEIFSKHKIIEQEEHVYRKSKDMLAKKGFVVAKVDVGLQQPLIFIDVHTDNKDVSAKRSQMRQIKAAVDTHMTVGPVIVAGDFNICQQPKWDDGSLYKELATAMSPLRDLFGGDDVVTFPDDGTAYDHFFLPPGPGVLNSAVVPFGDGEGRPTDHYGLVVELDPEQLMAGGGAPQDA